MTPKSPIADPRWTQHDPRGAGSNRSYSFPSITVTGADERTDIAALATLDAEVGILYSLSEGCRGRPRYPRWDWIREASLDLRRAALHVCGRLARRQLMTGELPVSGFQRIQVNGGLLVSEVEHLCRMYPRCTIITQFTTYNAPHLRVEASNHSLLVDASGGRGITPAHWSRPDTDKHVGFAGGLGPDNLADQLDAIRPIAHPGWWVDMEEKLRVDGWFSIEKAQQVVEQFYRSVA